MTKPIASLELLERRMRWEETRNLLIGAGVAIDRLPKEWKPSIDLSEVNLIGEDLRGANLGWVVLYRASLRGINLCGARMYGAFLRGADLRKAYLSGADLTKAAMYKANLHRAKLRQTVLVKTCLLYTSPSPRDRTRSRMPSSA